MKKVIIITLVMAVFIGILYSYGALDNMISPSDLDKGLISNLNSAEKSINRVVEKQAARTILNK